MMQFASFSHFVTADTILRGRENALTVFVCDSNGKIRTTIIQVIQVLVQEPTQRGLVSTPLSMPDSARS